MESLRPVPSFSSSRHNLDEANRTSSVSSSTTKVPSLRYENSHRASSTAASSTPPPSSTSVSTSMSSSLPAAPYPINMGYFPPQPWAQPYGPPYPYAVPVVPGYGYAGYPYPPIQPFPPTFFTREASLNAAVRGRRQIGLRALSGASRPSLPCLQRSDAVCVVNPRVEAETTAAQRWLDVKPIDVPLLLTELATLFCTLFMVNLCDTTPTSLSNTSLWT